MDGHRPLILKTENVLSGALENVPLVGIVEEGKDKWELVVASDLALKDNCAEGSTVGSGPGTVRFCCLPPRPIRS